MPAPTPRTIAELPRVAPGARRAMLVRVLGAVLACLLALVAVVDPTLGIAGALAVGLAVGFLHSSTLGICAFVAVTYFEVVTEYLGSAALSPVKLCGGALILIALVELVTRSRHGVRMPSPAWSGHPLLLAAMVGFIAVGVASLSWAVSEDQVRTLTQRLVTEALVFLAIGTLLLRRFQFHALSVTILVAGVVSTIGGVLLGNTAFNRALGMFQDPNEYAAAMVVSIGLGYGAIGASRSPWMRRALVAGIAICGWGVLASQSRGGLVALALAGAWIVMSSRGRERVRMVGATAVLVAAGVAVLMLTPTGQQSLERITDGDSSGRSDLWRIAVLQFQDEPLHGVGLGNYPVVAPRYVTAEIEHTELVNSIAPRTTHNMYLEIAAELGMLGLVTFATFVGGSLVLAMRGVRLARRLRDEGIVRLGRGLIAATVGMLASGVFLSGQYEELLWVLLAACVAYFAYVVRQLRMAAAIETAQQIVENLPIDEADLDVSEALAVAAMDELDTLPELLDVPR
jgi:putative inorganic carbon (hco3(-)) transporter